MVFIVFFKDDWLKWLLKLIISFGMFLYRVIVIWVLFLDMFSEVVMVLMKDRNWEKLFGVIIWDLLR